MLKRGRQHESTLVRKPDAGNPPVRFDERGVETERLRRHRATPRLYQSSEDRATLIVLKAFARVLPMARLVVPAQSERMLNFGRFSRGMDTAPRSASLRGRRGCPSV